MKMSWSELWEKAVQQRAGRWDAWAGQSFDRRYQLQRASAKALGPEWALHDSGCAGKLVWEPSGEGFKFGGWYRQCTGVHLQEKYRSVFCSMCGRRSLVCTHCPPSPQHQAKLTFSFFPLLAPVETSFSLLGIPVPLFAGCQDQWCPLVSRGDLGLLLPSEWLPRLLWIAVPWVVFLDGSS